MNYISIDVHHLSCSYSYNDIIKGITDLIGLYGGLSIICRLISIFIVKHIICRTRRVKSNYKINYKYFDSACH